MSTSKTGKHGHAKVHMVALDIFTNKKLEDICPSTHNMDCPVVKRKEYQLLSINEDGFISLMDLESCDTKDDLRLPEGDLGNQIKDAFEKDENGILVRELCLLSILRTHTSILSQATPGLISQQRA